MKFCRSGTLTLSLIEGDWGAHFKSLLMSLPFQLLIGS